MEERIGQVVFDWGEEEAFKYYQLRLRHLCSGESSLILTQRVYPYIAGYEALEFAGVRADEIVDILIRPQLD